MTHQNNSCRWLISSVFALMLMLFIVPSASAWVLPSASYDAQDKTYSLSAALGLWKIADVKLLENTDNCFIDCKARRQYVFYDDVLPSKYGFNIYDVAENKIDIMANKNYLVGTENYEVEIKDYGECEREIEYKDNQTLQTIKATEKYDCFKGTHKEQRTREKLTEIDMGSYSFKKGETYIIETQGKKKPTQSVEWIEDFDGFELDEWAWWNTTYQKKKIVWIKEMTGVAQTNYEAFVNVTWDSDMQGDFSDLAFTEATETSEIFYFINKEVDSTWAEIYLNVNLSASTNTTFYMYYGIGSSSPRSNTTKTFHLADSFTRANKAGLDDTETGQTWTYNGNSSPLDWTINGTRARGMLTGDEKAIMVFGDMPATSVWELNWIWNFETLSASIQPGFFMRSSVPSNIFGLTCGTGGAGFFHVDDGSWSALDVNTACVVNTNYSIKIVMNETSDLWYLYIDGLLKNTDAIGGISNNIKFNEGGGGGTAIVYVDNFFNRTYLATQPVVSFGTEEIPATITTTLLSPDNNKNSSLNNINFTCNSSVSGLTLKNVTFKLYNPDNSEYASRIQTLSGTAVATQWNLTDLPDNTYKWNCLSYDTTGLSDWDVNRTLYIDTLLNVSTISPTNETNTTSNDITFLCNATTSASKLVSNTLYIYDSAGGISNYPNTLSNQSSNSQWTLNDIADGNYTWNCFAEDNSSNEQWGINKTLRIDTVAPTTSIIAPANLLYNTTNSSNNTLQYAYYDASSGVDKCYYTLDGGANTSIPGCVNWSFNAGPGTHRVILNVTDGMGHVASANVRYENYNYSLNFTNPVNELISTTHYFNITANTSVVAVNASIIYNGTTYTATKTSYSDRYAFVSTFITPSFSTSQSNVNVSFYWNMTLFKNTTTTEAESRDTESNRQQIDLINIDNCTSYTTKLYNFTYYDELNETSIYHTNRTLNMDAIFRVGTPPTNYKNITLNVSRNTSYIDVCIYSIGNQYIDAEIKYSATDYKERIFQILNRTVVATDIPLYLLYETAAPAAKTQVVVRDEDGNEIENVYVQIERYYQNQNEWRNISWTEKTGASGETMVWLQGDQRYRFNFWKNYGLLDTQEKFTTALDLDFIILPTQEYQKWGEARGVTYTLSFNNVTNTTTLVYNAAGIATADFKNATLWVWKRSAMTGRTLVCMPNSTAKSDTISCIVNPGGSGTYLAVAEINRVADGKALKFQIGEIDFSIGTTGIFAVDRSNGVWTAIMIISVMAMIGIAYPPAAMILGVVGFAFTAILGLIEVSFTIVFSLIIVGIILIMKTKSGGY